MGKSTVGALLSHRGVAIIDTDQIARDIVEPGKPALPEIVQRFGPSILRADNALDRQELARRVFADSQARADLEAILHPRVREIWTAEVGRWRNSGAGAAKTGEMKQPGRVCVSARSSSHCFSRQIPNPALTPRYASLARARPRPSGCVSAVGRTSKSANATTRSGRLKRRSRSPIMSSGQTHPCKRSARNWIGFSGAELVNQLAS